MCQGRIITRSGINPLLHEVNMSEIPNYKTLNKLITGKIDEVVKEYTKDKRNDILK